MTVILKFDSWIAFRQAGGSFTNCYRTGKGKWTSQGMQILDALVAYTVYVNGEIDKQAEELQTAPPYIPDRNAFDAERDD